MQDFKHLTRKKRFSFSDLLNRPKKNTPRNAYKKLIEPEPKKRRLRVILPAVAVAIAAYPVLSLLLAGKPAASSVSGNLKGEARQEGKREVAPLQALDWNQSFQLAAATLPSSHLEGGRLLASLPDGGKVVYAINEEVQQRVLSVMEQSNVPYGVFVAIEPKSGKVLAMAAHSSVSRDWESRAFYSIYPMASLFKIITATAALEQKKVTPESVVSFRGGLYSESAKYWSALPKRGAQEMDVTTAMGKSVNPVFGRLACDVVGKDSIVQCAERYGFNHALLPGTPVQPSKAEHPKSDNELRLMGAGLGREVKISPVHAATMMAAIANGGTMLAPSLAEEIRNGKGEAVFIHKPKLLRTVISPETAAQLTKMLSITVSKGTSRKAFHDRRGRPKFADINIAAKTGSINGKEPDGHYNWFAAYAPVENPKIALVALVINQDKWKIKASYLGEQALEAFFR